ncbi:MAG: hypothetical protein AAFV87_05720 [Pseudomonadota bacterium]
MTETVRPSVFLERRSYRLRRLMDALRVLPVAGLMLWMFPLFWPIEASEDVPLRSLSEAVIYVFVIWFLLIAAGAILWFALDGRSAVPRARAEPDDD